MIEVEYNTENFKGYPILLSLNNTTRRLTLEGARDLMNKLEKALNNASENTSSNSDYAKCLDELWEHIELNAKNGSFLKSSIAEILRKHFV